MIKKIKQKARQLFSGLLTKVLIKGENKDKIIQSLYKIYSGVIIQNSGICNACCIFCPYKNSKEKKNLMPDVVFDKIKNEFIRLGGGDFGFLCVQGDPLLDPYLTDRIIKIRNIKETKKISMITNAIDLHKIDNEKLLSSGLNAITISTSIYDNREYKNVYGSNKYNQMYNNIITLLKKNKKMKAVDIHIAFRSSKKDKDIKKNQDFIKLKTYTKNISFLHYFASWGGLITKSDLIGNMKLKRKPKMRKYPCAAMFWSPTIFDNGDVGICSCRESKELLIGNILDKPLDEIWFSKKRKKMIDSFSKNKPLKVCKNCTFYQPPYSYMLEEYKKLKK